MRQCAICKQNSDIQWLTRYTLTQTLANAFITSYIHVCDDCQVSTFSAEDEMTIFINYKNNIYKKET